MSRALGDYWGCLDGDHEQLISNQLQNFKEFEVLEKCDAAPDAEGDLLVPFLKCSESINVVGWITDAKDDHLHLRAIYPYFPGGGKALVRINDVTPWETGIEGNVTASIGKQEIVFFDPLFPVGRDFYYPGSMAEMSLSGMANSVHKLSTISEISNRYSPVQERIERLLVDDEVFLFSPEIEEMEEMFCLMCRVIDHKFVEFEGLSLNLILVRLAEDIEIPVIFGDHSIRTPNWRPETGEYVSIAMFLFGYRTALELNLKRKS